MSDWLLTATPIVVLLLAAGAELLQSFQTRHLPMMSASELSRQQPALHPPGQFLRYWPRVILGMGHYCDLRPGESDALDTVGTVRALLGLVLLWLLVVIVLEIAFRPDLSGRRDGRGNRPVGTRPISPRRCCAALRLVSAAALADCLQPDVLLVAGQLKRCGATH